ncbi:MAG: AI-2E family transporter [Actinomycetota bacterium]
MERFVGRVLAVIALAVVALAVWQLSDLLLLMFGGILLSLALRAGAEVLARITPLRPAWAVPVVLVLTLAALAGAGWLAGARVGAQFAELSHKIPAAAAQLQHWAQEQPLGQALMQLFGGPNAAPPIGVLARLGGVATSVLGGVAEVVLVLMVTIYLAVDPDTYRDGVVALVPPRLRLRARAVLADLAQTLRAWLVGQAIAMASIGVLTTVGLLVLGIPLALSLGVIAGLLEFIPFVGPVLSAVPAILVAFAQSPMDAVWTALLYLAIQQVEGHVAMPLIQARAVALPPALTVVATVGMGMLFGFTGMLFATPLVAAGMVLVRMVYVEGLLERDGG